MKRLKKSSKQTKSEAQPAVNPSNRELTPPDLEMIAEREDDRRPAETHIGTIHVLRDRKQFTFQEISDWFKDFGIVVDRHAIYRAYMNHLPVEKLHDLILSNEEPNPDK